MISHDGGFSVLVVSAERSIRQTRLLLLQMVGHAAEIAESSAQAEEILQVGQFDAVVLDHTLNRDER